MDDDEQSFFSEMAGVRRLDKPARVRLDRKRQRLARDAAQEKRRAAAVTEEIKDSNALTDEGVEPLDRWYVLEFKRPGVQNGVFRKLKQGRYEAEASLDLHRMTVAMARRELFEFVEESRALGLRSVMLIHGKGESSPSPAANAVLKGYANQWLRELPSVQAFHSAQPHQGGTGAVYVLLQKSEEKKRENRLRFSRGRVPSSEL